jgi:hypothetical protein
MQLEGLAFTFYLPIKYGTVWGAQRWSGRVEGKAGEYSEVSRTDELDRDMKGVDAWDIFPWPQYRLTYLWS